MSNAKLTAARELIQEKNYDAARKILETMDDPTARRWLAQLDSIAPKVILPPPPALANYYPSPASVQSYPISTEQERFYRAENRSRRRRRIGNGINLIFLGIVCFIAFAYFAMPYPSIKEGGKMVVNLGVGWGA